MNQPVPIFIPRPSAPAPDPECPHCNKKLPGWSEPAENGLAEAAIILVVLSIFITVAAGSFEGASFRPDCGGWFSKRVHYAFPGYQIGCKATLWLLEDA